MFFLLTFLRSSLLLFCLLLRIHSHIVPSLHTLLHRSLIIIWHSFLLFPSYFFAYFFGCSLVLLCIQSVIVFWSFSCVVCCLVACKIFDGFQSYSLILCYILSCLVDCYLGWIPIPLPLSLQTLLYTSMSSSLMLFSALSGLVPCKFFACFFLAHSFA